MPTPDAPTPVRAVRTFLGALQAPTLHGALVLEDALAGVLATLARAPLAATFDPLARPAQAVVQPWADGTHAQAGRRGRAVVSDTAPGAGTRAKARPASVPVGGTGIGAALGAPATAADQTSAVIDGITAAVAAVTSPLGEAPVTPAGAARTARGAALAATDVIGTAGRAGSRLLEALPGGGAVAPALGEVAALADALWWRIALAPPAQGAQLPQPAGAATPRGPQKAPGAPSPRGAQPAPAGVSWPAQAQTALATVGELVMALYARAADAGTPDTAPAGRSVPAPRAPSVLVGPAGAAAPTSRAAAAPAAAAEPSGPAAGAVTPGVDVTVDADALARSLRTEAELRGVAL